MGKNKNKKQIKKQEETKSGVDPLKISTSDLIESDESMGEVINVPNTGDFASENDEFTSCIDNVQDIVTGMADRMGMDIEIDDINDDVNKKQSKVKRQQTQRVP